MFGIRFVHVPPTKLHTIPITWGSKPLAIEQGKADLEQAKRDLLTNEHHLEYYRNAVNMSVERVARLRARIEELDGEQKHHLRVVGG